MISLVEHGIATLPENLDLRKLESYLAQRLGKSCQYSEVY